MTIWIKPSSPTKQYTTADRITQAGELRITQAGDTRIVSLLVKYFWNGVTSISSVWSKITNNKTIWD